MPKIVVFGAGLVAKPMVQYLLEQPGFEVKVASRTVSKAENIIEGYENGSAVQFDITQPNSEDKFNELIQESDLAVSLLPYIYHVQVANACINHGKNMVTTSYVSDAMQELDAQARDAGIIILNEVGLDPGIDHMSAMRVTAAVSQLPTPTPTHGVTNSRGPPEELFLRRGTVQSTKKMVRRLWYPPKNCSHITGR